MKRFLFILLAFSSFCFSEEIVPSFTVLKHREHQGVGYDTGYSSIDVFLDFADFPGFHAFFNPRGHVFNDGRLAFNIGIGGRYLPVHQNWMLGANIYYDFRDAKIFSPQQLGGGLELFYGNVTLRMNGYGPIGTVKKKEGKKAQVALANLAGEAEILLAEFTENIRLSGALGVYYLLGRAFDNKTFGKAWGSQLRLTVDFWKWVEFGIDTTYDHIFNFIFQGYLALKIPLGPVKKISKPFPYESSFFRSVRRQEIIPLQRRH